MAYARIVKSRVLIAPPFIDPEWSDVDRHEELFGAKCKTYQNCVDSGPVAVHQVRHQASKSIMVLRRVLSRRHKREPEGWHLPLTCIGTYMCVQTYEYLCMKRYMYMYTSTIIYIYNIYILHYVYMCVCASLINTLHVHGRPNLDPFPWLRLDSGPLTKKPHMAHPSNHSTWANSFQEVRSVNQKSRKSTSSEQDQRKARIAGYSTGLGVDSIGGNVNIEWTSRFHRRH